MWSSLGLSSEEDEDEAGFFPTLKSGAKGLLAAKRNGGFKKGNKTSEPGKIPRDVFSSARSRKRRTRCQTERKGPYIKGEL